MQNRTSNNLPDQPREQKRETIFTMLPSGKIKRHRVRKKIV